MNILAVGAHYDDIELACSGTLIKHVENGDKVTALVLTNSGYSNPQGVAVRDGAIAKHEGEKAAALIGAELICFGYPTLDVPFDDDLTGRILQLIEARSIELVYTHWVHDIHRDHQHAGKSTLMAARHVPRVLMYRSNYYDSDQVFRGNIYSDITEVIERKVDVIKAHASELERVRYKWLDFFMHQHANDGQKIGVQYAECFEVVKYLI